MAPPRRFVRARRILARPSTGAFVVGAVAASWFPRRWLPRVTRLTRLAPTRLCGTAGGTRIVIAGPSLGPGTVPACGFLPSCPRSSLRLTGPATGGAGTGRTRWWRGAAALRGAGRALVAGLAPALLSLRTVRWWRLTTSARGLGCAPTGGSFGCLSRFDGPIGVAFAINPVKAEPKCPDGGEGHRREPVDQRGAHCQCGRQGVATRGHPGADEYHRGDGDRQDQRWLHHRREHTAPAHHADGGYAADEIEALEQNPEAALHQKTDRRTNNRQSQSQQHGTPPRCAFSVAEHGTCVPSVGRLGGIRIAPAIASRGHGNTPYPVPWLDRPPLCAGRRQWAVRPGRKRVNGDTARNGRPCSTGIGLAPVWCSGRVLRVVAVRRAAA